MARSWRADSTLITADGKDLGLAPMTGPQWTADGGFAATFGAVIMPNCYGLDIIIVCQMLLANGLLVGAIRQLIIQSTKLGLVVGQSIVAGVTIQASTTIDLFVSGPVNISSFSVDLTV